MTTLLKQIDTHSVVVKDAVPGTPGTPGVAGVPGIPPTPAHPAYCQKEKTGSHEIVTYTCVVAGGSNTIGPPYSGDIVCFTVHTGKWVNDYSEVCYPASQGSPGTPGTLAIPARPATDGSDAQIVIIQDRHQGWNGSAYSIAHFGATDNVKLTFRFRGVSAVCGLNDRDTGSSYFEIDHAFYMNQTSYQIMEQGTTKTAKLSVEDNDPTFAIIRFGGQVMYYIWVTDHWQRVYTSLTKSTVPIFADASIFMGGDVIG